MKQINIASIPADGIGPEVISAGIEVVRTLFVKAPLRACPELHAFRLGI